MSKRGLTEQYWRSTPCTKIRRIAGHCKNWQAVLACRDRPLPRNSKRGWVSHRWNTWRAGGCWWRGTSWWIRAIRFLWFHWRSAMNPKQPSAQLSSGSWAVRHGNIAVAGLRLFLAIARRHLPPNCLISMITVSARRILIAITSKPKSFSQKSER